MSEPQFLPNPVPEIFPSPLGPSLSFSAIKQTATRAESLLDSLERKVKKPIGDGLMAAGNVGAGLETKVLSALGQKLAPAETLFSDLTDLIGNQLVAGMAPAAALLQDIQEGQSLDQMGGHAASGTANRALPPPAVANGGAGPRPGSTGSIVPQPISTTTDGTPPKCDQQYSWGSLQSQLNIKEQTVSGHKNTGNCEVPDCDQANYFYRLADEASTVCPQPPGEDETRFLGQWYRLWEDCCTAGPTRTPNDLPPRNDVAYWDLGFTSFDGCAAQVFAEITRRWNAAGKPCSTMPPSGGGGGPPDGGGTPPTCPTQPCVIDVTCPPAPPCPPCPPLVIPSCVQVDLCDWDKLCKVLRDCLVGAKEDCALDNETAYTFKDCDGTFGQGLQTLLGSLDGGVLKASSLTAVQEEVINGYAALQSSEFPPATPP